MSENFSAVFDEHLKQYGDSKNRMKLKKGPATNPQRHITHEEEDETAAGPVPSTKAATVDEFGNTVAPAPDEEYESDEDEKVVVVVKVMDVITAWHLYILAAYPIALQEHSLHIDLCLTSFIHDAETWTQPGLSVCDVCP